MDVVIIQIALSIISLYFLVAISTIFPGGNKNSITTRNEVLNAVAHKHGLKYIKGAFLGYPMFEGEIEGLPVFLCWKKGSGKWIKSKILEISIRYNNSGQEKFIITSRGKKTLTGDYFPDSKLVKSGDDIFDSLLDIKVAKSPKKVIALLTLKLRKEIISIAENSYHLSLSNNSICVTEIIAKSISYESIIAILDKMVSISKCIMSNNDFKKLYAENIKYDAIANVKLHNLEMLLPDYGKDKVIEEILKSFIIEDIHKPSIFNKMLKSSGIKREYTVQYKVGKNIGVEGFDSVIKLVHESTTEVDNILWDALKGVGKRNLKKAADSLIRDFHNIHEEPLQLNILDMLKKLGDERFSSFLLSLLEHRDNDIVNGAVDALSTCGDVHAVEKILDVADRSINPFFRSKLNETVLQIQTKLGLAKKGWLSVSDLRLGEGKLSLADDADEGSLSIADSGFKKTKPAADKS